MSSIRTRTRRYLHATRARVYRALLDPAEIAKWMVPDGMKSEVHTFEPHEGGTFRISLTYDPPTGTGKTSADTDTYKGRFVELMPDVMVVERVEFETTNPELTGMFTVTYSLADTDGGTDLYVTYEGLPRGISVKDNEVGTRQALDRLAALVEPAT